MYYDQGEEDGCWIIIWKHVWYVTYVSWKSDVQRGKRVVLTRIVFQLCSKIMQAKVTAADPLAKLWCLFLNRKDDGSP